MTISFDGKVIAVLPLQRGVGQRGPWARATVVFSVPNGRYEDRISCENKSEAEAFSRLAVGQRVHVDADVTSREYQGKWYTTAVCYSFKPLDGTGFSGSQKSDASDEPF